MFFFITYHSAEESAPYCFEMLIIALDYVFFITEPILYMMLIKRPFN